MSEIFDGTVEVQDGSDNTTVLADGNTGYLGVGGGGQDGAIHVDDAAGASRVMIGSSGNIILSSSSAVSLVTISNDGQIYIQRTIGADTYPVLQFLSPQAALTIGGEITPGKISVRNGDGDDAIVIEGDGATLFVGAEGNEGDVIVRDAGGRNAIHLDGNTAAVFVGAEGAEGDVIVRDGAGRRVVHLGGEKAVVDVGAAGNEGDVRVFDGNGTLRIHLDGASGQVLTFGADCAEDFEVDNASAIEPGSVLVIDDTGNLRESCSAYDRRVAGVVSGGGSSGPGMVLGRMPGAADRKPVALIGKVYCKVDADRGAIAIGDMLTTADTRGHAMKAADTQRAFGAVIGKALAPLKAGRGMIPILVALQ
jgi:hypothetical protein